MFYNVYIFYSMAPTIPTFHVAIPSYKRNTILPKKTLRLLDYMAIPHNHVYIFVANPQEYADYRFLENDGYHVVVGELGLHHQRNFMTRFFPDGTRILYMDDDIRDILVLADTPNKLHSLVKGESGKDWCNFFNQVFETMTQRRCYLFGVYPARNPYFMSKDTTYTLKFVVGALYGVINRPSLTNLACTLEEKEDVERTLQFYEHDGQVMRINYVTMATSYYHGKGGMQSDNRDRVKTSYESAVTLAARYPHYCSLALKKKSGFANLRLRDKTSGSGSASL
jgi:hypothetical protein